MAPKKTKVKDLSGRSVSSTKAANIKGGATKTVVGSKTVMNTAKQTPTSSTTKFSATRAY